jgi:DNA-directed RNA polymerase subunit RPC12/RpoP
MSLKILCAGCSQEEREQAESDVRRALGSRADGAAWTVSLVKVAGRWSVTLAHPPAATITCVAPQGRLADAIGELLGGGGPPVAAAAKSPVSAAAARSPAAPAARGGAPARGRGQATHHECESCREPFVVRYEAGPDEAEETVPVACPHCWHRNYVLVAESAAETREYTAEKS